MESLDYREIPASWPDKGVIIFDRYKARYREGLDFVLHGLNIQIESGEKVSIITFCYILSIVSSTLYVSDIVTFRRRRSLSNMKETSFLVKEANPLRSFSMSLT